MDNTTKLYFPTVERIQLHHFSLYRLKPNLSLDLPHGVFCLAGANGLGKTTFLSTLNYGLTGAVPNLSYSFLSSKDYYQENYKDKAFTRKYFDGRISNKDRDFAAITLELRVNDLSIKLKRLIFTHEGLAYLQVLNEKTGEVEYEGQEDESEANEVAYQQFMCTAIGITSFEQYLFLQHFVLTFDESRRLLLWDTRALNEALYLCIGADYNNALKASEYTREMERANSRARNIQYQASGVLARLADHREDLAKENKKYVPAANEATPEEVEANHRALVEEVDKLQRRVMEKQQALRDCDVRWIDWSAKLSALQAEFEREFTRRIESQAQIRFHPTISATLSENRCVICNTHNVATEIQAEIDHSQCPLCNSQIPQQKPTDEARNTLSELDETVGHAREQLRDALQSKDRLTSELKASEDSQQAGLAQLRDFEITNARILQSKRTTQVSNTSSLINRLELEYEDLLSLKETQYKIRDKNRGQLLVLQKELKRAYAAAEEEFVPLLRQLAAAFLGIELEVSMEARTTLADFGLTLVLSVRNSARREYTQLSESQRFFLDIALRMALAQYISAHRGKAELLIDTPEGSLDIAYEARAGSMFADFVRAGHSLFMTANINSSQLLIELARECGEKTMTLHRMTSWSELSDVQAKSENLFNMAYSIIENELIASKK